MGIMCSLRNCKVFLWKDLHVKLSSGKGLCFKLIYRFNICNLSLCSFVRYFKLIHLIIRLNCFSVNLSHTGTVVRVCECVVRVTMGNGKTWSPGTVNPLTSGHQNLYRWLCRVYLPPCKFKKIKIGLGVSFLCMHDFVPLGAKVDCHFFGFLEKSYHWDARTNFHTQYVKRHGSVRRSAFWRSLAKPVLRYPKPMQKVGFFRVRLSPKPRFFPP